MVNVLQASNIMSNECYIRDDRHLIEAVTFSIDSHDCLGILATKTDESKVLLEELANLRPIYSGDLVLNGKPLKKTRVTLDDIFFIDGTRSLIKSMNVLEYLMYITSKFKTKPVHRQKAVFSLLLECKLGHISLTKIGLLNKEERMLIMIIATFFSKSSFIIINLNPYAFSDKATDLLKIVFLKLRETKTVIVATTQAKLIGVCCNKISYIHHGRQKFFGTTFELHHNFDTVMYILRDKNINELYEKVKEAFSFLDVRCENGMVIICAVDGKYITNQFFYTTLASHNIFPAEIKMNLGRIANAIEELIRNDI